MASNAPLSSSPTSVSFLAYDTAYEEICRDSGKNFGPPSDAKSGPITLAEFIRALPSILRQEKEIGSKSLEERERQNALRGTKDDPVTTLFSRLDLSLGEWKKYAIFDSMKNYTRNLIATDNETFTLLLLCWNSGKESPIHDHPCDGCWLRVCQGKVQETRYEIDTETDKMDITFDEVYEDDAPAFIKDSMGYHKVGNPSESIPAVTLHLYCPPFDQCKIWLDPSHASRPSNACMCNYSEYGVKHTCDMFAVNMI
mmetsp:Transcript_43185/g.91860  ORF Transcript_43185/g.91860 Transcript_43185/m.91860 type:complete len:255 (+) Transcript_43185:128-892(+)|eukprot:CAMPEP_0172536326 /NCGR_PEP_ID=MMETSP1067-20121228/8112_1 /TAXON_ID=265564 ORGANISM="Thalassiosira punctigera, Strain Tpunct2005C2" /NCGR_SAMPLE_ID=MMETSP1067 /ASSEMBLY_ACC=CAM_ASM_000444 /LENGTH=254 /DNA_ID=CAMNT_0013321379 /DNA_START=70 /DNA_END=834 /DNA_ORIENTATION=-